MATAPITPPARITLIGLSQMGLPMAKRLIHAGFTVRGADPLEAARTALEATGGKAFASATAATEGASAVITMLPNGRIVREVVLGSEGSPRRWPKAR